MIISFTHSFILFCCIPSDPPPRLIAININLALLPLAHVDKLPSPMPLVILHWTDYGCLWIVLILHPMSQPPRYPWDAEKQGEKLRWNSHEMVD